MFLNSKYSLCFGFDKAANGFQWHICDTQNRTLFGRRHNGEMVFMRYVDMSQEDKDLILSTYACTNEIDENDMDNEKIKDIIDYLNFVEQPNDRDFCG